MRKKVVALVGRMNVGKSTLFNRLSVRKKAIVYDQLGVTRDRKYADAKLGPLEFTIIDTPGFEESAQGLNRRLLEQTTRALIEAELICFVVDGLVGILPDDKFFAKEIRKYNKPTILLINKCEKHFEFAAEYYQLGFSKMVAISAEHNIGMVGLYEALEENLPEYISRDLVESDPIKSQYLQLVVCGRPNVGKSTFINALLNEERLLTGSEAGITRESIEIDLEYKKEKIKLIDTAGLRKKSNVDTSLEKLSTSDTINSIKFANTVILMIDSLSPMNQQDLNIASHVVKEGRSIVIVVNKWDLIAEKEREKFKDELFYQINNNLPQIKGVSLVFISAINKLNIEQVLDACIKVYGIWNKKLTTSKLNEWLGFTLDIHPLPLQKSGRRIRIKYITQIKTRPPTFKLFSNNPEKITDSYTRYLVNSLRDSFNLPGVPIRFIYVKTKNPYISS